LEISPRASIPTVSASSRRRASNSGEHQREISKQLNDLIVQGGSLIPLVHRGDVSAHANSLEGVRMNSWDSELWNIAEWTRTDG
ncbi:MAG: peptide ABC transporter substrate-binding protein, partial [Chloroflexota bacterium]